MLIAYGMLIDDCRLGLADWLIIVVPNPKSKIQNPKSKIQNQKIQNPKSKIRKSAINNQQSAILFTGI
jgi:hypothetical protein